MLQPNSPSPTPPIAKQVPHSLETHGHRRDDPYFWLRDRENPEVLAYLEAENAYTQAVLAPTSNLQQALFEEMKGRLKPDDSSVPYEMEGFWYYSRYEPGKEYPIFARRKGSMKAKEEIILNVNKLAKGQSYCQVAGLALSRDQRYLAYAMDTVGRRIYTLHIKDLQTGELLPDTIEQTTANLVWAEDSQTLFYTRQDLATLRSHRIFRHKLGESPEKDELVYEESDDTYHCYVTKTHSRRFLLACSESTLSTEVSYLDARQPEGTFDVLLPREPKHEYSVEQHGDFFLLLTNDQAPNFRLVRCPIGQHNRAHWEELQPHDPAVLLEDVEVFQEYFVLEKRQQGLTNLEVIPWQTGERYAINFPDPTYTAYLHFNPNFDSKLLRYGYQSLTTPDSVYEIDLASRETRLLKQQVILGQFEPSQYTSERLWAPAADGTKVPISLVRHVDTPVDGSAPLLLYGYGSYGASMDAYFSPSRLSLLQRGFIFAIAHVRGGSELGRAWYDEGRTAKKQNTFADFIACGDFLLEKGYTRPERLCCMGGSAGGLLIGAVINQRPDLFAAAIAQVPFVDVITTMLDDSIPLTTGEYDEWGNPHDKAVYDYLLTYSPYDNVKKQAYPALLVTTGLHDSQVQYWEPAKWVAKLRQHNQSDRPLLLHTNLEAGHSGTTGRYAPYKEVALEYAFLLLMMGGEKE